MNKLLTPLLLLPLLGGCVPALIPGTASVETHTTQPPPNQNETQFQNSPTMPAPVMFMCSPGATCNVLTNEGGDLVLRHHDKSHATGGAPVVEGVEPAKEEVQEGSAEPQINLDPGPILMRFAQDFSKKEQNRLLDVLCPGANPSSGQLKRFNRGPLRSDFEQLYDPLEQQVILNELCEDK